ncbi:selenocysteine-specific translation elongation factor, partial [Aliarcobacter butzleri]
LLDFQNGIYFKKGIDFEKLQEKNNNQLYEILKKQGIKPEAPYNLYDFLELDRKSGDNILKKLTQKGLVVRLSHNLFIEKQALEKLM